ncbi:MAG: HlyD family efflux transporter periplasmic adaptor subunit [Clostridia bacterium]|nr:HlyD family efflux transporter periplasmic adaptor subunit [Clostridia bacterium]
MNEKQTKKRAWVKNAAIIFLSVMLVLTLFSNTIMNYSLPEVSGQYIYGGTITTSIRGSGTVAANQTFNVTIDETRKVKSVLVKNGDTVEAGQTLLVLEDEEGEELKAAVEQLESMRLAYSKSLMSLKTNDYFSQNLEIAEASDALERARTARDNVGARAQAYASAHAAVQAAQARVDELDTQIAELDARIAEATAEDSGTGTVLIEQRRRELELAKTGLELAKEALEEAKDTLARAQEYETSLSAGGSADSIESSIQAKERELEDMRLELTRKQNDVRDKIESGVAYERASARYMEALNAYSEASDHVADIKEKLKAYPENQGLKDELETATAALDAAEARKDLAKAELDETTEYTESARRVDERALEDQRIAIARAEEDLSEIRSTLRDAQSNQAALERAKERTAEAKSRVTDAERGVKLEEANVSAAEKSLAEAQKELTGALNEEKKALEKAKRDAQTALTDAQRKEAEAERNNDLTPEQAEANVKAAQKALNSALHALEAQKKDDNITAAIAKLDLDGEAKKIAEQEEKVAKLRSAGVGTELTARYGGIVNSIGCVAGDSVSPGMTLAVIEVSDKGYTVSFAVTTEQSQKVHVGDRATITGWWWGGTPEATLISIKNDQANPGKSKILTFELSGEVTVGQTLNLTVGEKNSYYDVVVPNSAVREDSKGKFVLVTEAKSTPLGNRYIATRVDVTVSVKDDTNSAISGGLYGGEYVITTSTKPIDVGSQVRLVD